MLDLLTINDVLKLLGDRVTYKGVLSQIHQRKLTAQKIGKCYWIAKAEFNRWKLSGFGTI
jgi:hypothetical protein